MISFQAAVRLLIFLTLLSIGSSVNYFDDDEAIEKGDKYIDDLLRDMVHENGHEYDPYLLEDSRVGFWKKITFVNVSGEAKLHNGYITGLKSLHRPDHCSLKEKGDRLHVSANLGAGVLNFHYDGTVKFMNVGPTISVHGEVAYVETDMEFTVDAKTGRDGKLLKFNIVDMKGMKVTITGLGPMNWAMNYLISGITSLFRGFLGNMLEKKVRSHVAERLPKYQFPVTGVDITEPEPETNEPETEAPEPETDEPETEEPEPETDEPETEEPEPETEEPETDEPEPEPETEEPETEEPEPEPEPETEEPEPEPEPELLEAEDNLKEMIDRFHSLNLLHMG